MVLTRHIFSNKPRTLAIKKNAWFKLIEKVTLECVRFEVPMFPQFTLFIHCWRHLSLAINVVLFAGIIDTCNYNLVPLLDFIVDVPF